LLLSKWVSKKWTKSVKYFDTLFEMILSKSNFEKEYARKGAKTQRECCAIIFFAS
jgi:hypothetical protein